MQFSFVRGAIFAMGKRGSNVCEGIDEAEGSEECEEKRVRNESEASAFPRLQR